MSIKYTLIQYLRPLLFLFVLSVCCGTLRAQISSGDKDAPKKKEKKEKVKTEWNEDSLTGTNYYITGLTMWSYRQFEDQSVYGTYSEREKETGAATGGLSIGVVLPLANYLSLDIGFSYWGHGEKYAFQDSLSDSAYSYKRRYLQLGIPLRFRATFGDRFQSFLYGGVTPLNIVQMRYDDAWTDMNGGKHDIDEIKIKNDFAPFNIMVAIGAGLNYNLRYIGLTFSAEYRRNMLNSYDTNAIRVDHRMYGIAFNYGIYLRF
jgi:hypothetical protein